MDILEYEDANGSSPFGRWFAKLDAKAAAKVTVVLTRLDPGNTSNVRGWAHAFSRSRSISDQDIVYFGKDNATLVILLGGGTKKRQANDIAGAQSCWQAYKRRKRRGI